ncbi:hypothetical protein [Desulfocastanea catecholica]
MKRSKLPPDLQGYDNNQFCPLFTLNATSSVMTARPKRTLIMGVRYNPLHGNALPGGPCRSA